MKRFGMMTVVLVVALGLCMMAGCSLGGTKSSTTAAPSVTTASAASTLPETSTTTTAGTTETSKASGTTDDGSSEGWTTVMELSGSDTEEVTSEIFTLSGAPTRILWKAETDSIWTMAAFVEAEGHDLQKQGGFPVFWESKEKEGSKTLERGPGKYYLHVTVANAAWSVTIQEKK